ncbi:MAG: glycoside hydrolase family 88 protein [Eubacteriales bacterium]|nr:glycoside hydrolase family 88 protein [Eubacteriales bacterium]
MKKEEIQEALDLAIRQVETNLPYFGEKFPAAATVNNLYPITENDDWTNGFYTGMCWLAYEETGNETFCKAAQSQVESFYQRILAHIVTDHHDMGFLYSPSCVAAYKLTKNERGREAALLAAQNLLGRFQEKGAFFQAWGPVGDPANYRLIIDSLLNMPLLFWASETTGDPIYRTQAARHIQTTLAHVVREDASTCHTFYFDPETGAPLKGVTQQGNRDGSIWARGQAWGIYGSALSYRILGDPSYLEIFRKVTDCFLQHLPKDQIPYWDFDFTDGSTEPRDSSSAAIAACGLLEMAGLLPEQEGKKYREMAANLIAALTENYLNRECIPGMGILLHGTYAKKSPYNGVQDSGVDECNLWGDYFYMEALTRLKHTWNPYW